MTRFIDVNDVVSIVDEVGFCPFIDQLSHYIEDDFSRWSDFEKTARLASHSDIGVIELMPSSNGTLYGFKYVNGHPANTAIGLSTVMAFGALTEVNTGYPLLLSELTITTAFRTAATSIMAARHLARDESTGMAMIGCGAQSEFQSIAFHSLVGIHTLNIYDVDSRAMHKLKKNLSLYPGLSINVCSSAAEAVRGMDIVTTVTADKTNAKILTVDMIEPGIHINALGGDCPGKTELDGEVLQRGNIFVEYEPQSRVEGEIQQLDSDHSVTEISQVIVGDQNGRDNDEQITIFDSVGFAMEDFSSLRYLFQLAESLNMGSHIQLVPEMKDPKNLFEMTLSGTPRMARNKVA